MLKILGLCCNEWAVFKFYFGNTWTDWNLDLPCSLWVFFWLEDFWNSVFPIYFGRIFQYVIVSPQNKYQKKIVFPFPEGHEKSDAFPCILASLKVIEVPYGLAFLLLNKSKKNDCCCCSERRKLYALMPNKMSWKIWHSTVKEVKLEV